MPITALDARTARIVMVLQKGMVALPTAHPADAFRRAGLPVVLVNVAHANSLTRILPRLGETGTVADILDPLGGAAT